MIPVLILAAGQSTRMRGADKLCEDVGGVTLLRHQIEQAKGIGPVFVALPSASHPRMAALSGTSATAIYVPDAASGMGATMRDAVTALPECAAFMVMLGDLISLNTKDLRSVVNACALHPDHVIWRGATPDNKPGHPIIFDASMRSKFADLTGDRGGEAVVKPHLAQTYLHKFNDNRARHDLDTPEDFAHWRKGLGQ